jgi:Ca2+-dependent lipid-binding protein
LFVCFSSQENKRRIKHISKTLDPVWNQTVIYGHMHREEVQYKKLEITVWDFDRFKANDFLGQVTIDLKGKFLFFFV